MAVAKTFKIDEDVLQKLEGICKDSGLTWSGMFAELAAQYKAQEAASSVGRATELETFSTMLTKVKEAYAGSLVIAAQTEERIRNEFMQRMTTQEAAIAALKEKLEDAKTGAATAAAEAREASERATAAEREAATATSRADVADQRIKELSETLADRKARIKELEDRLRVADEAIKAAAKERKEALTQQAADLAKAHALDQREAVLKAHEADTAEADKLRKKIDMLMEELQTLRSGK